jgi:hypothetical protein
VVVAFTVSDPSALVTLSISMFLFVLLKAVAGTAVAIGSAPPTKISGSSLNFTTIVSVPILQR